MRRVLLLVPFFSSVFAASCGEVVEIEYDDVVGGADVTAQVAEAFGPGGYGILAVTGVPASLTAARRELLGLARNLARLPEATLAKYERPDLNYIVGWSRGREKFLGTLDDAKGSFYANAIFDSKSGRKLAAKYPASTATPAWPDADLNANFSGAFKHLSRALYDLSYHVLRRCDYVVDDQLNVKKRWWWWWRRRRIPLAAITHKRSRLHVSRLLHYYPSATGSWCGWHNDNSVVTALVPAMFYDDDDDGRELRGDEVPPDAGLEVFANGEPVKVKLERDDVVFFQIGEAAQVLSGGALVATPHRVVAGTASTHRNISRESFAIFVEPNWDEKLKPPPGRSLPDVYAAAHADALIPPLPTRLPKVPVEFAQFLADSVREYYEA
ncbi:hypothetical protein CTAYLR_008240 [Chrysophaeum taylorii]|uniref:Fe2OG dioxygenase domain-containing protein n=1 Tax=Chrysophaeum taylorii TaxID=2483200 RepID=A0AAD7UIC3_9STRA|nr:hypothetical protein CTAYLR_008240 [Chrysophaeum taylorii]